MLLIDADNVSADVIEQAVQRTLATHGAAHVRRAYCNAETALKQQALFKRLSVRPMVNLSAGKNSTDIAMAVDAMDLVIAERPDLVVLVSSDSDFAPLVVRLREKGCRVCGIGQRGKTGEETRAAYDEFIDLAHQGGRTPAAPPASSADSEPEAEPASRPARKTVARKSTRAAAAPPVAASHSEAEPVSRPARKAAAKKGARAAAPAALPPSTEIAALARRPAARKATRKTAASAPAVPAVPAVSAKRASGASAPAAPSSDTADRILQAVPALRGGSEVALNDIAKALRAAKLLGKHASSIKLFDKLPAEFAVLQHPDRIRWLGAARG